MVEREVAYRMFAQEFNDSRFNLHSNSSVSENHEIYSPNFLISPTGLKVNRILVIGVITEVDRLHDETGAEKELWRARISDPTGAFTVYSGSYQPDASYFLSNVKVPSYVMVLGKVRSYEPGDGSVYVSLRPEEINNVEESLRDRWVVDTAEMTLKRIGEFESFFSSGKGKDKMAEFLLSEGVSEACAAGMSMALDYYHNDMEYYDFLKSGVKKALCSVRKSSASKGETDYQKIIESILEVLDNGNGFDYSEYMIITSSKNIPPGVAETTLKSLLSRGHIYEPKAGLFRVIR